MSQKLKVLVTGANGLVGSRFIELAKTQYEIITPEYPEFDLTDPDSVMKKIIEVNPDWVVNFAAFTDVNAAESGPHDESSPAWKVNVEGVKNILQAFLSPNIIHISTDMVFPGNEENPGPYPEDATPPDTPEKLTWYGWTKNRGEKLVRDHGGNVLRIIYPVRANFEGKLDYIRSYLSRFAQGKGYPLFADQQMSISYIDEVSDAIIKMIDKELQGEVCHASSDTTTPHELLSFVFDQLNIDHKIPEGSIKEFLKTQDNPNRYPVYGGLKTFLTEKKLDMHFSTWQTIVEKLIDQGLKLPEVQE